MSRVLPSLRNETSLRNTSGPSLRNAKIRFYVMRAQSNFNPKIRQKRVLALPRAQFLVDLFVIDFDAGP